MYNIIYLFICNIINYTAFFFFLSISINTLISILHSSEASNLTFFILAYILFLLSSNLYDIKGEIILGTYPNLKSKLLS